MNNGVYALPGFMTPAAKNWKSQLLTNEDGSVKLCVYVGKPGTKVYYSLGIPGWKWGFIKDAQYFIDKGYPQEVIDEVSKFADYLEEEVAELPKGAVVPDIVINGWPVPITESPIEDKVYWILNIPKFVLPAGDTEVQISANGKLIKYTLTRPYFSIHYNIPECTTSADTPEGDDEIEEEDCEPKGDYLLFNADRSVRGGRLETLTNGYALLYRAAGQTEWSIPLPKVQNGELMFANTNIEGEWHFDLPELVNGKNFLDYTKITAFTGILPKLQDAYCFFRGTPMKTFTAELPELLRGEATFDWCKVEYINVSAPKVTTLRAFLRQTKVTEIHLYAPLVTNCQEFASSASSLRVVNAEFPSLNTASSMFNTCQLDKPSVLKVCNSLPSWNTGSHPITLGIHVDHKFDDEVLAAIARIDKAQTPVANGGKGWTVTVQWNGTSSAASASTYNLRGHRDPIYAKKGEDSDGKPYLDWGHYVTDWEENGYMEFASIEEAKEHFNIVDDINLINAE